MVTVARILALENLDPCPTGPKHIGGGAIAIQANLGALKTKPKLGMTLAFKPTASEALAGMPAKVVYIWPRFRSGDYLVTLEYADSVKLGNEFIRHIDAFMSELEQPREFQGEHSEVRPGLAWWLALLHHRPHPATHA
jgi:hypothetical protein